ncbi:GNAT family N-acetyltransferase [Lachnospiraceae bacterium 54-53]
MIESQCGIAWSRHRNRKSIYEDWRSYENGEFLLRPVQTEDAGELLKVYSDQEARKLFNVDNFPSPCFFDTLEQMRAELKYYHREYENKGFVRWSVTDKKTGEVFGTVENFHRKAMDEVTGKPRDAFHDTAILRVDIRSDYEREPVLSSLILLILETAYEDFECVRIATKAPKAAAERRRALAKAGFTETEDPLIGHKGQKYGDYFIRERS